MKPHVYYPAAATTAIKNHPLPPRGKKGWVRIVIIHPIMCQPRPQAPRTTASSASGPDIGQSSAHMANPTAVTSLTRAASISCILQIAKHMAGTRGCGGMHPVYPSCHEVCSAAAVYLLNRGAVCAWYAGKGGNRIRPGVGCCSFFFPRQNSFVPWPVVLTLISRDIDMNYLTFKTALGTLGYAHEMNSLQRFRSLHPLYVLQDNYHRTRDVVENKARRDLMRRSS
ncbi:hypothetical protein LZ32DRAFT_160493 [Colletotrichum eremochloae]|nr:hypothetical protein LZ32DRAFT_160493 [Colletotrichum eremochloae]